MLLAKIKLKSTSLLSLLFSKTAQHEKSLFDGKTYAYVLSDISAQWESYSFHQEIKFNMKKLN